jgi:putative two-component system response regulator
MQTEVKPTVLVVDDAPDNLMLIKMLLQGKYRIKLALNGEIALRAAAQLPLPELILLDVMMPDMDGYEVCRKLKSNPLTAEIPVLFLTAKNHLDDERRGFQEGALDYVTKPIDPEVLQARVATHLQLRALRAQLLELAQNVDKQVEERTREMEHIQDATVLAVAAIVETGDSVTRNHLRRTQNYVGALARKLQQQPQFAAELCDANIALIFRAVPLHDIGKVGSNDPSLRNPGKLSEAEIRLMHQHTIFGRDSILGVEQYLGVSSPFLKYAREICYSHQERFDGSGYPEGLRSDAIPLAARLMAVADTYDALISKRSYKEPISHEEAIEVLREGSGTLFDPLVIGAMLEIAPQFKAISEQYHDPEVS